MYIVLSIAVLFGVWRILESILTIKLARRNPEPVVPAAALQATVWIILMLGALATPWTAPWWAGVVMLLVALCLPLTSRKRPKDDVDEWGKPAAQAGMTTQEPKEQGKASQ